jgi:hypothetical protein
MMRTPPFALSLSKACLSCLWRREEGQGFDKLSPNGVGVDDYNNLGTVPKL